MNTNDNNKSFDQRREELLKSRLITENGNQSSQYLESLVEDVVLNGVSFDNQLPIFIGFAENEGLDANQLKNDIIVLLDVLKSVSGQPSKSEKMGIVFQAQRCHISEEVILRILSELQEKKKKEQEAAEKKAREKVEAEQRAREQAEAEKRARDEAEKRAREKAEAEKMARQKIIDNLISNMVYVEGGTFIMSESAGSHQVTLSSFSIGRYEVTQEEWEMVMGNNPSNFNGAKNPVENVSWNDCQEFIRKLNALTGKKFRLPTEAEWEFAASGGNKTKGYKYSGSNRVGAVAWYENNSGKTTQPVGLKSRNELGLYDMSGNVWEWCGDWFGYYGFSSQTNPKGAAKGTERVCRGGCFDDESWSCWVSRRARTSPDIRGNDIGLRLCL